MNKLFLLFFLIITTTISAQNSDKIIIIKDADTEMPIEDVSVYVLKTKQLLLSNEEGKVLFSFTGNSSVQVSHSSYTTVTIRSSALDKTNNIIYLKANMNTLDEIIVTKSHPQKILKSLVQNSAKKLTVPARLKVYSREFFKLDGSTTYYNDGLLNFQLYGKDKKFKTDILIEQNRAKGVINEEIKDDVLGYDLNNIMENYYNFKYLEPVIAENSKKEYEYIIKAYTKNDNYNLMLISPTDKSKGLLDNYSIIYNPKSKLIIEITTTLSPQSFAKTKEKRSVGSKNIYKSNFKSIYKVDSNNNYYLISSKEEIGFELVDKKNITKEIEVKNYLVVTEFSTNNFVYKDNETFKEKTLYNKKNVILTDFWNVSGLTATQEEQQIIDKIE